MHTAQEAQISCPAVAAQVKFLASGDIVGFGIELKLSRFLQNTFP